jgi:hypothetical protein
MFTPRRLSCRSFVLAGTLLVLIFTIFPAAVEAGSPDAAPISFLKVDDVRVGMIGAGKTVLKGTELTEFKAEVVGVMRSVSPGRDMILCKLSGARLEYTGVIAGMSGSPIYVDGKLMGAVAYTWAFNKEPLAGVTPIEQIRSFAEQPLHDTCKIAAEADGTMPIAALDISGSPYAALEHSTSLAMLPVSAGGVQMTPISIPLAATGFSQRSLAELSQRLKPLGMVPVASGGAGGAVAEEEPKDPIIPGGTLGATLVTGDFDLSGIGTVTHVEGNRVWGWGHPFIESGNCEYILRSGYVHLVNPKHDLSTKMASPLSMLGVIRADVSTCIAGELGAEADLLPVNMILRQEPSGHTQTYRVKVVRHPTLLGSLVATVLSNALDGTGALDSEITINLDATIQAQGLKPIELKNTYSGSTLVGSNGAKELLNQVAVIADGLTRNPFSMARLESIDCQAVITRKRTSASIQSIRLNSDRFEPGDEVTATVTVRPYKSQPEKVELKLRLPDSLPPGEYTAAICDAPIHLKSLFAEEPSLLVARNVEQIARVYRMQLEERRKTLYLRVVVPDAGLTVGTATLPQLPASAVSVFTSRRATAATPVRRALVSRHPTEWVIEGSASLPFTVVKDKKTTAL